MFRTLLLVNFLSTLCAATSFQSSGTLAGTVYESQCQHGSSGFHHGTSSCKLKPPLGTHKPTYPRTGDGPSNTLATAASPGSGNGGQGTATTRQGTGAPGIPPHNTGGHSPRPHGSGNPGTRPHDTGGQSPRPQGSGSPGTGPHGTGLHGTGVHNTEDTVLPFETTQVVPSLATLITVISGATTTEAVLEGGGITSAVPLITASSVLPAPPSSTSANAIYFANMILGLEPKVLFWEKHKDDPDPPVLIYIKNLLDGLSGFLSRLTKPPGGSGGCTVSLWNLVSCAISDVESLSGKIKADIEDDISNLLDDLKDIAKKMKEEENDDDDDKSSTSGSSSSSSTSSGHIEKISDVCIFGTNGFKTCSDMTPTANGLESFTSTTSMTTSISATGDWPTLQPYTMAGEDAKYDQAASAMLASIFAQEGGSVSPGTAPKTTSSSSITVLPSCSTTTSSMAMSPSGEPATTVAAPICACDDGDTGATEILPGPTPTSYLVCDLMTATVTMSTMTPSTVPSAAVEIMLQYNVAPLHGGDRATWYLFKVPDTAQYESYTKDEVCGAALDSNSFQSFSDPQDGLSADDLKNKDFLYPNAQTDLFDVGSYTGCLYGQPSDGKLDTPGWLDCNEALDMPCIEDPTPYVACDDDNVMVPKVWCHPMK